MAGRRSVFSDPRVIELTREFVSAADEVWRLQRGADEDCHFFQRMVNKGRLITDDGTRQGIYVAAPSGKLLARVHSNSAERVLETMQRGLEQWNALPSGARGLAPDADLSPEHRWESNYPRGGLALECIARDLPESGGPEAQPRQPSNRDSAWFQRGELVPLMRPLTKGEVQLDLAPLALRLARFHLVDDVRGQTLPFAEQEVLLARLKATLVRRTGARFELDLAGATDAESDGTWHLGETSWTPTRPWPRSVRLELHGRAVWDAAEEHFSSFELVALGERSGRTQFNGRGREPVPHAGRIGFAFSPAAPRDHVPPTYLAVYGVPWVVQPANPGRTQQPLARR